ncbi:hypothetical protein DLR66_01375 [Vibrio paracholerae]|nr:hypothetical protein AL535_013260 [Vibrio cholerae]RBM48048.1 hypothetical protein DLR66_01375 [Vibrio paracholerae]RBM77661.1 hypothetical protein DLR68_07820 [Vibrio paracholerae]
MFLAVWQTILPQFIALGLIGARRERERSLSIPFLLDAAAVLATFVYPNHIVYLCSWGGTHLPPTCNSK